MLFSELVNYEVKNLINEWQDCLILAKNNSEKSFLIPLIFGGTQVTDFSKISNIALEKFLKNLSFKIEPCEFDDNFEFFKVRILL